MANSRISALPSASTPLAGTELVPIVQGGITEQVTVANLTAGRTVAASIFNPDFGLVGAPSVTFGTETTTGFYRSGANTVSFSSAGVVGVSFGATSTSFAGGITGGSGFQVSGFSAYRASGASASSPGDASMYFNTATGQTFQARAGSSYDWSLINPGNASYIARVPTGTLNLDIAGGNLIFSTSGKGIDFSATPGTGTSELFADYEEGTWTPVVSGTGTAGTYQIGTNGCTYTKIGRTVTLQGFIQFAAVVTGGGTGSLQITGLPFSKTANSYPAGSAYLALGTYTGISPIVVFGSFSASSQLLLQQNASGGYGTLIVIGFASANAYLTFTLSYEV